MKQEWTAHWSALPGERFELGEGVRYLAGRIVMVDILSGRLLELPATLDAAPRELCRLAEPLGAVAPLPGGGWLAAAGTGFARLDGRGGAPVWLARPADGGAPERRMNDAAADPAGRFWAGSMAYEATPGAGALHRLEPEGGATVVVDGMTVPNGPVFTADGATMYLADSARGVIYRYPVDPATGALAARAVFAEVDAGSPDGMAVDNEGYLWSAIWGGGQLRRYAPSGELDRVVPVPVRQPTSLCFTGDRLVVTSASAGLVEPGELDGAVLHTPVPVAGVPVPEARLPG